MRTPWRHVGNVGMQRHSLLTLATRWQWMVCLTPWPIYRSRNPRHLLDRRLDGPQILHGRFEEEKSLLPPAGNWTSLPYSLVWCGNSNRNVTVRILSDTTWSAPSQISVEARSRMCDLASNTEMSSDFWPEYLEKNCVFVDFFCV